MKLTIGKQAPLFSAKTAHHGLFSLNDLKDKTVLLQFYRFANCPVCNLSLRSFAKQYSEFEAAGVYLVAIFHSSTENLRNHLKVKEEIPYPLVADPDKLVFQQYGVESSPKAMMSPAVFGKAIRAIALGYIPNSKHIEGGQNGLPADFIVQKGVIQYAHYGKHAGDTLAVNEVLQITSTLLTH